MAQAGVAWKTRGKWRAEDAAREEESRLSHRALVGVVMRQRAGLGTFQTPWYEVSKGAEEERLIQEKVKKGSNDPSLQQLWWGFPSISHRVSHPLVATVFPPNRLKFGMGSSVCVKA